MPILLNEYFIGLGMCITHNLTHVDIDLNGLKIKILFLSALLI